MVGLRVGQYLIDGALCASANFVLGFLVGFLAGVAIGASGGSAAVAGAASVVISVASGLLVLWVAHAWWPATHGGQTPAMTWLGIRIVTVDGRVPGLGTLSLRVLLLPVDLIPFGLVGLITMCASAKHQRVADMVAGTVVVRA